MGKNIKRPVTRGRAKVPVVMQLEALECGAACLAMVLAYYGKWIPLEQVRRDCGVSRDGSNARNLLRAARNYGLTAKGYRFEPEDLQTHGQFPCILHWNFNHFVVLCGFHRGQALLNGPARGTCAVSMEEFDKSFTCMCLQFEAGGGLPARGAAQEHAVLRPAEAERGGGRRGLRGADRRHRLPLRHHQPRLLPDFPGPAPHRGEPGVAGSLPAGPGLHGRGDGGADSRRVAGHGGPVHHRHAPGLSGLPGGFHGPASQLIGAGQTLQEMRPQMERVEDVMDYPSDTEAAPQEAETSGKLSGALGGTYTQLILNE